MNPAMTKHPLTYTMTTMLLALFGGELVFGEHELWLRLTTCGLGIVGTGLLSLGCYVAEEIVFDDTKINF